MLILALDVDVAVIRAAVLDVATALPVVATACVQSGIDHPSPEAAELRLDRLWSAVSTAARSVAQAVDGIEGVGLCVITPALVLLDDQDKPAAPIWLPDDRRARSTARQVQAEVGEELLAETGNGPIPGLVSALSFRQMLGDDPYLIREVRRFLHLNGWLALHMTGNAAFDPANASLTGVYGTLTTHSWSQRWCEYFEVDPAWLPPVLDRAPTVGTIRSAVAAELGVAAGLPLKLGTDPISLMIQAAEMKPWDLLHDLGDPQRLIVRVEKPRADGRRLISRFGLGKGFLETAFNPIGPRALRWLHALCFRDQSEEEFRERTIPQAMETETRVAFDPPFLTGDSLCISANRAAFRDLTIAADRMDLLASLLSEMRRRHELAIQTLKRDVPIQRILVRSDDAEFMMGLLPYSRQLPIQRIEAEPLTAICRLFH
jgi:sugar (pentulose or hexulose) kinase